MKRRHPLRRNGRLRRRSPTNSHPETNVSLRQRYREANPYCEAFDLLYREQRRFIKSLDPVFRNHGGIVRVAQDVHHLWHPGNRPDLWSNLITLCRPIHDWAQQQQPTLGRVLCHWCKLKKSPPELDLEEIRLASGMYLGGWLASDKVVVACDNAGTWWSDKRLELLAFCTGD